MKWVQINKAHFNTNLMTAFFWAAGKLRIYWVDAEGFESYEDPDRANYLRLCQCLGVRPVEVKGNGKS